MEDLPNSLLTVTWIEFSVDVTWPGFVHLSQLPVKLSLYGEMEPSGYISTSLFLSCSAIALRDVEKPKVRDKHPTSLKVQEKLRLEPTTAVTFLLA